VTKPRRMSAQYYVSDQAREEAMQHYAAFMNSLNLGGDPDTAETPRRVTDALIEMCQQGGEWKLTEFDVEPARVGQRGDTGMVLVRSIPLKSMCAHHVMPFYGHAHIAYIPEGKLVGLSKFARMVETFAAGLQTQEIIGQRIADFIMDNLQPRGCMVVLAATHTCMSVRGACAVGAETITSSLRGVFYEDIRTREEAMRLLLLRAGD
jgi:GTP cyclohydrolase IA